MKHSRLYTIGMVMLVLVAASVLIQYAFFSPKYITGALVQPTPILSSCSSANNEFFGLSYDEVTTDNDVVDQWSVKFHDVIDELVTAQLDETERTVECTAETMSEFLQPTTAMQNVVQEWEPFVSDPDTTKLSRLDVGYVLLELLRQYECALQERQYFLYGQLSQELVAEQFNLGLFRDNDDSYVTAQAVSREAGEQQQKIVRELVISRKAVEQAVRMLNGKERTAIVRAEVECLERASLDIRNATGLAAEANSCLPRIWNAKDTLYDLPE